MRLASGTSTQELKAAKTQGNCQSETFRPPEYRGHNKKKRNGPGGEQMEVRASSDPSKCCRISHANYECLHWHNNCVRCILGCLLCTVHCELFSVCCELCILHCELCTVRCELCTLCCVPCTMKCVLCIV